MRQKAIYFLGILAFLIFLGTWAYLGYEIFIAGVDPDRLLATAYTMAGAFIVAVPCLLFRIYVRFDRRYRSENNSNKTEEKK